MKRLVNRVGSLSRVRLLVLGLALLLAALGLTARSAAWAHDAKEPGSGGDGQAVEQQKAEASGGVTKDDKFAPVRIPPDALSRAFDYETYLKREKNGEFPSQAGPVIQPGGQTPETLSNVLINNNNGGSGTGNFTQSESSIVAFGNNVVVAYNDSGSYNGVNNKFTGWSYSTDGGFTFTDGGQLPTNTIGDAGDPTLARDATTGRIYLSTLGFNAPGTIQVFHSDDNALTWSAPVNGTPGGDDEDKSWIAVDNAPGAGNGNLYLISRRFGVGPGIYVFRSTDQGNTFGPTGGTLIVTGSQGAFIAVGPSHEVYAFWYAGTTLQVRKSTDTGLTFGPPVTVASGLIGGTNGDLGLTGLRQGTGTFAGFRSNEFPHAVVNPANGNIYVTYNNKGAGTDKADVFVVFSSTGGASWSAPIKVNDDATTTDQFQPTISVTPDGGTLGVFYYSRQEDPASNNSFKYYGRVADLTGGVPSFAPSFAVSNTPSLPEFGRDTVVNSVYMGDYNTAYATGRAIHVAWSDNRDDLAGGAPRKDPNMYYANISLTLHVTTTVPAVGSIVGPVAPTVFTVNVSEPVNPATLNASDFTVNGLAASTVAYTPGSTTMTFTFGSTPVTAQGLQTMHVSAGAFASAAAGDPVAVFDGTFRYDLELLHVVSTSPPFPGGVFSLPSPLTYEVTFNEPIDPASVQASDLILVGIGGSSVTGALVLPGNTMARFTLSVPGEGTLTASIGASAITDQFGNPGTAFSASYAVDIGTVPYPTPLSAKPPLGSLIYDPSISGVISPAGDTDSFTLPVDPGQTLTVLVTPTSASLQPTVTLKDPSSAVIGSATAGAPGQAALLQTVPAATGGTYTMTVGGAGGTTGNYTLQVTLNAALELEGIGPGASNDTLATAQDISSSFITLQTSQASAQRGAVTGAITGAGYSAAAVPFTFEDISTTGTVIAGLTGQDDTAVSIPIGFTFPLYGVSNTTVFVSSNGLMTFGTGNTAFTNADLTTTPAQASIAPFWDDLHTAGGVAGSNVYFQVSGSGSDQHLTIQWNKIRFFTGGTAGDTLTFEARLYIDGRIRVDYLDLVSGAAAGNNGASATVGIKASGTQGPDRLLLAFNNGPNAFVGTGLSTLISPPNPAPDYYSYSLAAGDVTTLALKALPSGTMTLELRDSADVVVATGVGGSTNLDLVINNFTAASAGTYYARVTATTNVPYNLVVTRNAALDTEGNDNFATAQPAGGNKGALGDIALGGVYQAAALSFTFEDISTTGTVIAGLTGQDDASVSIPIGFTFPFYGTSNTTVFVSSNGLLTFGGGDSSFTNADMTTSPSLAGIAPFWDDMFVTGSPSSNVLYQVLGSGPNQHVTIQWNQVSFFSGGAAGDTLTLEAQLYADGRIQFNYQDLVSGAAGGNNGASATVGIKASGAQGPNRLLLAFNNGPNAFVGTGKSTLISLPATDDWYSIVVPAGQTALVMKTSTPSDGPGEFVNTLNPHIELYSPANVLIASGTPLADGRNESLAATGLAPGTYAIRVAGEGGTTGEYFLTARATRLVSGLSPAMVWVGLANSDDVGVKFDLLANVKVNGAQVGTGHLDSVAAGSSGFNNAKLDTIPLTLTGPVEVHTGDTVAIQVFARNACVGSGHNSGRARLWYNGKKIDTGSTRDAGSRFDSSIDGVISDYFLRTGFALSKTEGTAKASVDVQAGAKCSPFVSFGTWTATVP